MLRLKSCPRCHGDQLLAKSLDERSATCLQCGHGVEVPLFDPKPDAVMPRVRARSRRRRRLVA